MNNQQIMQKLAEIKMALSDLESMIHGMSMNMPMMNPVLEKPLYAAQELLPKDNFETFKYLLESPEWPKAVEDELICDTNNEEHKNNRACGIVDVMITVPITGKKILDFGAGEGHVAKVCAERSAELSVGFDVENNFIANNQKNTLLTSRWRDVQDRGPYDVILACDVLDHLKDINPVEALKKMKEVLAPNGKIFVRYHSFMSRHYAHLYKKINKAFVHLIFTTEELRKLFPGEDVNFTHKVYFPIKTYNDNAAAAGLRVENEYKITSEVEDFFQRPEILDRIYFNTPFKNFPKPQMEMDFVDHILIHQ